MVISCNGSFIDMIVVYLGSYDRFSLRSIPIFFGKHCSEFACQSSQSFTFLQIVPIVQIINSITYVESGWCGRPNPSSSALTFHFDNNNLEWACDHYMEGVSVVSHCTIFGATVRELSVSHSDPLRV